MVSKSYRTDADSPEVAGQRCKWHADVQERLPHGDALEQARVAHVLAAASRKRSKLEHVKSLQQGGSGLVLAPSLTLVNSWLQYAT